jgi:uncharacterized protein YxjI
MRPTRNSGATRKDALMGFLSRDKAPVQRFQMHQKMMSIGDDYWIEDDDGHHVYKVDGKVARLRDTWVLEDLQGNEVASIKEKALSIRDKIKITLPPDGEATVKKALVGFRDRFHIEVNNGDDLKAKGNIVDHEYEIERDGHKIAEISKKWFRIRDTYARHLRRRDQGRSRPGPHPGRHRRDRCPRPRRSRLTGISWACRKVRNTHR